MDTKKLKELQDDMVDSAHKIWLAGLGAVSIAGQESGRLFEQFVTKGREIEEHGHEHAEKARATADEMRNVVEKYWQTFEERIDDKVAAVIQRAGIPTKDEIRELTDKVDDLTQAVEKMRTSQTPKKTAARGGKRASVKRSSKTAKKSTGKKTSSKT